MWNHDVVQDAVRDPTNPLLIVNGRLQKTLAARQGASAALAPPGPATAPLQYVEVQAQGRGVGRR